MLQNLTSLIDSLTLHYTKAIEAELFGNSSLYIIQRQYGYVQTRIDQLVELALVAFERLAEHTTLSQLHNELSRNASNAVAEYKMLLPAVVNVSQTVLDDVAELEDLHDVIERILINIQVRHRFLF